MPPRARLSCDSGVVAPTTAVLLAVLIGMVGLVTDASVWYAQRHQLQAVTDAAALAAAPFADNPASARQAADAVLIANGVQPATVVTAFATGQYCYGEAVPTRFRPEGCADATSTADDAVRVATGIGSPLFLSRLFSTDRERRIAAVATAARVNQAGIQAGTGVASLNAGAANAALSSLTGSTVSLTAVQYDGLLGTNVDALTFLDALATRLNVRAGTYESLLRSSVGVEDIIAAQIAALGQQGQTAAVTAAIGGLQALTGKVAGNPRIALGRLFDLGLWSSREIGEGAASTSALHAGLNLMQLTSFTLQLANKNNAAAIPASAIGIPGLASIRIAATAIEPPVKSYFSFGPEGTRVHTAQVRVKLELQVLGLAEALGVGVGLPLYIEAASGDAEITDIACTGDPARDATVGVSARSGIANVYIGTVSDSLMRNFSAPVSASAISPVPIVKLSLLGLVNLANITARAHVSLGSTNGAATALTFVQPGTSAPTQPVPPTRTGVIGRPATSQQSASAPVLARATSANLGNNLLGGLAETLVVNACAVPLGNSCLVPLTSVVGAATGLLYTVLDPVLTALDPVLDGLLRGLGVQLGYVDVAVTGVRCGHPVLVS